MKLLVDREIADAPQAFECFGEVALFDGRALSRDDFGDAEVLLVRSVTRVGAALLQGSGIRFVGTSTAGTDHVDQAWLSEQGITFVAAPGCNAQAVAEHVVCCMAWHAAALERTVESLELGIVGYGHVGKALGHLAAALGIRFVVNDPPLGPRLPGVETVTLDEAMARDVVSIHVPLTLDGPFATAGLLNHDRLELLPPRALLINAARGGVVDESALLTLLATRPGLRCAIDCWAGEPCPNPEMLLAAHITSPHIAGHSREARLRASDMLRQALCRWLDRPAMAPLDFGDPHVPRPALGPGLAGSLAAGHDLGAHTQRMAGLAAMPASRRGAAFDDMRRQFGLRREFPASPVACRDPDPDTVRQLHALGIECVDDCT